jgi:uncharacterized membrane protein YidH (DUF202 family)
MTFKKYIYLLFILILVQAFIEIIYRHLSFSNPEYRGLLFLAFIMVIVSTLICTTYLLKKRKLCFSKLLMILTFGISIIGGGAVRWIHFHYNLDNQSEYFHPIPFVLFYWSICFVIAAIAVSVSSFITISNSDSDIIDQ